MKRSVAVSFWLTVGVQEVQDVWTPAFLNFGSKFQKDVPYRRVVQAQRPSAPLILGHCSVHVSHAGPRLVLICSYTPL